MKVIFLGTPDCGCPYLPAIEAAGGEIVAVITQPDRPAGRGRTLCCPPVKTAALDRALCVLQPPTCRDQELFDQLQALEPDIFLVVAFGQILCPDFLKLPRVAALNVHYSLLPAFRGAAPVQHALLAGLPETGVTLQHLARELDAGDVVGTRTLTIDPADDTATLTDRLTGLGCDLVAEMLPRIMAGEAPRVAQDETQVSWAPRLQKRDGALDWHQPAAALVNRVRALRPWPGVYCELRGEPVTIWRARQVSCDITTNTPGVILVMDKNRGPVVAAADGAVELLEVQPRGRKSMTGAEFARGARLAAGDVFGPGKS